MWSLEKVKQAVVQTHVEPFLTHPLESERWLQRWNKEQVAQEFAIDANRFFCCSRCHIKLIDLWPSNLQSERHYFKSIHTLDISLCRFRCCNCCFSLWWNQPDSFPSLRWLKATCVQGRMMQRSRTVVWQHILFFYNIHLQQVKHDECLCSCLGTDITRSEKDCDLG